MRIELTDIINKEKGKKGIVLGLGPSAKKYLKQIRHLENNDEYIIISCNTIDEMSDIIPDYWVLASSVDTIQSMHQRINKCPKTTVVYADSVDMTPKEKVKSLLSVNYIPYDQRHFDNKNCPVGYCCNHREEDRLTIQELLKKYTNYNLHYSTSHTVANHMLALAILLGLNPIYITGVDLDYRLGYLDNKTHNDDHFDVWLHEIISDFKTQNDSANNVGVKIINLSDFSKLNRVIHTDPSITF